MGFIDHHLMDGESVVYRTRLHPVVFLGPALWLVVAAVVAWHGNYWVDHYALSRLPREALRGVSPRVLSLIRDGWHGFNLFGLFLLAVSALPGLLSAFVNYASSEFGVSNKRVLMKTGFLARHSLETLLSKVESIGVHQGLLGRILGFGTIIIGGTGGSKEAFFGIRAPLEFRRRVQEQIVQAGP